MMRSAMIETACAGGRLAGRVAHGVRAHLGVPFARPPVGELRLASPRSDIGWQGVRDAGSFGAAPHQTVGGIVEWIYPQPTECDEDCLNLNVWAPEGADASSRLPVLFWLYGGAFQVGANSMALCDGAALARDGNMVVVAPNYRVGILGFAAHPELNDVQTGAYANWGLQDQACALRWTVENIGAFGGDPARITVMGQSAGAHSAVLLAQSPQTSSMIRQLALMSVPYIAPPDVAEPDDLAVYVAALARRLGTSVSGLRDVPATTLIAHEAALFKEGGVKTPTGLWRRWPIRDSLTAPAWAGQRSLGGKPLLIGNTRSESSFQFDLFDTLQGKRLSALLPTDSAGLRREVEALLRLRVPAGLPQPDADMLISRFAALDGTLRDAGQCWLALHGDASYRHPTWRIATQAAAQGSLVYYYEFGLPLVGPARGTPHNADIPFWFGSHHLSYYAPKFGVGASRDALSKAMRLALAAFVANGKPSAPGLPVWPELVADRQAQGMHFGHTADTDGPPGATAQIADVSRMQVFDPLWFPS